MLILFKGLTWTHIALFNYSSFRSEFGLAIGVFVSTEHREELLHALRLIIIQLSFLIFDSLDFDLAQFDLAELVRFVLALIDDRAQICLADLTITVMLVDVVLIL